MDTKSALETWTGKGAREAAERATKEGRLYDLAQSWGKRLEARKIKEDHVMRGGQYVTVATWGVFLAPEEPQERPGQGTGQSAPARRPGGRVTSS